MTELTLFASTYALVMLLGLQSLHVNKGHMVAAFLTSFGIGTANLVLFKMVPDATTTEILAYLIGGPLGIITAMWLHPRIVSKKTHTRNWIDYANGWNACRKAFKEKKLNTNCGADRP